MLTELAAVMETNLASARIALHGVDVSYALRRHPAMPPSTRLLITRILRPYPSLVRSVSLETLRRLVRA